MVSTDHGSSPPNFRGDLKISYQNYWGGPVQKIKFGAAKFKGGPKILGGWGGHNIVDKGGHSPSFSKILPLPAF